MCSFSLISIAVTAGICTWSSVHGRHCTYIHIGEKEKKKRKKLDERVIMMAAVAQRRKKKKKKRISKIIRIAHSTTDNVDYYHHRDTYTYYNTYAALA